MYNVLKQCIVVYQNALLFFGPLRDRRRAGYQNVKFWFSEVACIKMLVCPCQILKGGAVHESSCSRFISS